MQESLPYLAHCKLFNPTFVWPVAAARAGVGLWLFCKPNPHRLPYKVIMTSQGAEPGRTWVLPSHRYFFTGYIFPTSVISMFGFSVFVPVTVLSLSLSLSLSSDLFSAHAFCLCLPLCVCVCACSLLCGYFRFVSSVSTLLVLKLIVLFHSMSSILLD
jgi:hypothetical protein